MKRISFLVFFTILFSTNSVSAENWLTDLEQAKMVALSTDKLVLVDFWATWCGPCKKMDMESWSDPEVQKLMESYVPVKVDIDAKARDALKYNVRSIPYVFIIDGNGQVVYKSLGYMNKNKVLEVLKKYALNTSFLKNEAISYFQHQNYVTSLRLGEKYLDYSLYLKDDVKRDFIDLAQGYITHSEKLLKRKQDNYSFIKEKIELLELTAALYANNERAVEKTLSKKSLEDIDPKNRTLYAYINLCLNKKNRTSAEIEKWTEILESAPGSEKFFIKAELFSKEES